MIHVIYYQWKKGGRIHHAHTVSEGATPQAALDSFRRAHPHVTASLTP